MYFYRPKFNYSKRIKNAFPIRRRIIGIIESGDKMYRVLYKGFNGNFSMSDEMSLEKAQEYKQKLINAHYLVVYIIQIVE